MFYYFPASRVPEDDLHPAFHKLNTKKNKRYFWRRNMFFSPLNISLLISQPLRFILNFLFPDEGWWMPQRALVTANWAANALRFVPVFRESNSVLTGIGPHLVEVSLAPPPDAYDVDEGLRASWQSAG